MEKIIVLGHENPDVDSIVSGYILEKIIRKKGYNTEFIIPDEKIEKDTLDICKRYGLNPMKYQKKINLNDKKTKYILVDHHERTLEGEIICIIDHHPTSKEIKIENYHNNRVSSTACYICQGNEELLDEFDLCLAILATIIDTASFHSTKSREEDKIWTINICNKYNLDYDKLYKEGLSLTVLDDLKKASLNGHKKYNIHGNKVESSYIQIEDPSQEQNSINKIINILRTYIKDENIDTFVFIVYNMKDFKTMYYLITKNNIESRYYEMYVSRGDTIIPEIEKKIIKEKTK